MLRSKRLFLAAAAALAALTAPGAQACDDRAAAPPKPPAKESAKATAVTPPASAARPGAAPASTPALPRMVVTRDKETGRLRMATPGEIEAMSGSAQPQLLSTPEEPVAVTLPDGSKYLDLTGRYFSMAVARKGPDGKVVEKCVGSEKEKAEFLLGSAPAPPKPAVHADEK
jgi:hypothetical protein